MMKDLYLFIKKLKDLQSRISQVTLEQPTREIIYSASEKMTSFSHNAYKAVSHLSNVNELIKTEHQRLRNLKSTKGQEVLVIIEKEAEKLANLSIWTTVQIREKIRSFDAYVSFDDQDKENLEVWLKELIKLLDMLESIIRNLSQMAQNILSRIQSLQLRFPQIENKNLKIDIKKFSMN